MRAEMASADSSFPEEEPRVPAEMASLDSTSSVEETGVEAPADAAVLAEAAPAAAPPPVAPRIAVLVQGTDKLAALEELLAAAIVNIDASKHVRDPAFTCLAVLDSDRVIGGCCFRVWRADPAKESKQFTPFAELVLFAIDPAARGRRLGSQLMQALRDHAAAAVRDHALRLLRQSTRALLSLAGARIARWLYH
jgi:GNAT superfamily N-acetyltransferase